MLNDGISMWASVAVILHDNHIISHCILVSYSKVSSAVAVNLHGNHIISHSNFTVYVKAADDPFSYLVCFLKCVHSFMSNYRSREHGYFCKSSLGSI